MQVRRNQRQSFIRRRRKRSPVLRRVLLLLLVIVVGGTALVLQPDMMTNVALDLLGPDVSPTPRYDQLARMAEEAFWSGDLEGALTFYERAQAQQPENISYLYEQGMLLIDLSEPEPAQELAERILQLNPNDPRGYALRARSLVWQGNSSAAVPVATAGLDLAPDFAPLQAALARALLGEAQLREAQEAGLRSIELDSSDVRSYWAYATTLSGSGARDEAILELERTTDVHPRFLPPYFELAFLYLASNRDQEAIDTYDVILGMQPRNARALLRQCLAYRKVGQLPRAKGLCQDAVDSDPQFAEAQFWLGVLRYRDFEFEAARAAFESCVDIDPDYLECNYQLGLSNYYVARDVFRDTCGTDSRDVIACTAFDICRTGYDILQDSLILAQAQPNTDNDIATIQQGLSAIATDSACRGVVTNAPSALPQATPEAASEG